MRKVYNDLCELIANDEKAEGYFALLPEFVKARLYKSPEKICSFDSLCDTAEQAIER